MPSTSSNQRSSSTTRLNSSRRLQNNRALVPRTRSASVASNREFIVILTNNPDMLRQRATFRMRIENPSEPIVLLQNGVQQRRTTNPNHVHDINDREQVLTNLLRVELTQAIQDYLSRTHQSSPLHFIFDVADTQASQAT